MNLKHLETFYHFCRCHSMTLAAQRLNVTQPAISQQLYAFEQECGVRLFYREANLYKLTDVGESIFLLSKFIFSRVEQIETLLLSSRKPTLERLRIGATKDYASTLMPELVARFQNQCPNVQVQISEGNSSDLMARLKDRKEDLVVVARNKYDSCFKSFRFAVVELVLVARPDHPLSGKSRVSIKDLCRELLIIREQGSGSREAILKKLGKYGIKPSAIVESGSLSFILAYIERRMGVSFVMVNEVSGELSKGTLKKIDLIEGNIRFPADIVVLREECVADPIRQFLKIAMAKRDKNFLDEPSK